LLEYREDKATGQRALRPPSGNRIIIYIQDLHLARQDQFRDMGSVEAMRDYLTTQSWLSTKKVRIRKIQDISFFADMATNHPET